VPLTPTDVANKQFKIAFRGYALEEVDAFLDEVESELARLLRDNNDLKNRAGEPGGASPAAPPPAAPAPVAEPEQASRPVATSEGQEAALRTLLLAQRTADEAIAEAQAEAQQLVTSARAEAEQTLSSARSEAEQTVAAARQEADATLAAARQEAEQTLAAARREAESTLGAAQHKASQVDQEVAARIHAATGNLDQRRAQLERHIDELRAFEREYRTRLKAYLETQLRDLTGRGGPDDDGGAGVPVAARAAAVGGNPGREGGAGGTEPTGQAGDQGEQPSLRAVPPLARPGDMNEAQARDEAGDAGRPSSDR
jgi:DivIVA domain-containing protein